MHTRRGSAGPARHRLARHSSLRTGCPVRAWERLCQRRLLHSVHLSRTLQVTIGSGPGWYRRDSMDPDLGSAIEFASWIELSVAVGPRRIGIDFSRVSNAHLGRINPGSEGIGLSMPLWKW